MDDEPESPAAALAASSATQRKWASFVLLGPLLPSVFAIMIIVVGGAIVKVRSRCLDEAMKGDSAPLLYSECWR